MKKHQKDLLLNLILSTLSLCIALFVAEATLRFHYLYSHVEFRTAFKAPEDHWSQYDSVLGWKHITDKIVLNAYGNIPVHINQKGLRSDREFDLTRKKILAIGCSFTFGHGVGAQNAWPQNLESKLKSDLFDYDVLNMGACAYGLDQSYLWYIEKEKEFNPNIVILGLPERLHRVLKYRWITGQGKPRYVLAGNQLVLTNVPVPKRVAIGKKFQDYLQILFNIRKSYLVEYISRVLGIELESSNDKEKLEISEKLLQAINDNCKQNGRHFLVVLYDADRGVKEILTKNSIDFVELSLKASNLQLKNDPHPSVEGHELIASTVYQYLLEHQNELNLERTYQ